MITLDEYRVLVREILGRDLEKNPAQSQGVSHGTDEILMVVAGPGSGKTTVLVLRSLRHVLVDGILPEHLLITTFTRKAARELRTRWLDWGSLLLGALASKQEHKEEVARIDLNRCRIDTLDSVAQQALTENKLPGELAPILLEGAASKLILKRSAFASIYDAHKDELDRLFSNYTFEGTPPRNRAEALSVAKVICERLVQDRVDLEKIAGSDPAFANIVEMLKRYMLRLEQSNLFDFASLELRFLERLQCGTLGGWTNSLKAILIDEYQDSNILQEQIYFQIISLANKPLVTVVGDDDQAMYRFRGGSVELFTHFESRCESQTGRKTKRVDMVANYRSSAEIVAFYNAHVFADRGFLAARIAPPKPPVVAQRGTLNMPVLGMFRESPEVLAEELAGWFAGLLANRQVSLPGGQEITLPEAGDAGDFVFLSHSVEEVKYNVFGGSAEPRFAGLLRQAMNERGLQMFNPRGRALRTIPAVQQLLGLLLLCLDPSGERTEATYPTNQARFFLSEWRHAAQALIAANPMPSIQGGLGGFVGHWASVSMGGSNDAFPPDWPVLELIFKLITWIPGFQGDPEHQVWLEAITRTVSSAGMGSPYGMQIYKNHEHRARSRESFIRDALLPLAENECDVDEDIMPSVPRNRLQLMTIHQSKGLEFPLVVVDVGSHFTGDWVKQRFLRFPEAPSNVVKLEDTVEPFLLSRVRTSRHPLDRTFDDLVRLYYVAYSRPQSVLMLVGCEKSLSYGRSAPLFGKGVIPNVALGWARDRTWPWRQPFVGKKPPVRIEPPFVQV